METELVLLNLEDPIHFHCGPSVACFTQCCRDLNQPLFPYDVLRLKNGLNLTSGRFLAQYASRHVGPETGLPVVSLRPAVGSDLFCPFVSEKGCAVYPDRPGSCRAYPLVRLAARSRETGEITERYYLLREDHCKGFGAPERVTVSRFIKDQGLGPYNAFNDRFMELIALKNKLGKGPLDMGSDLLFFKVLYDLDDFRRRLDSEAPPEGLEVSEEMKRVARADDEALLELGFSWIKTALFRSVL